MYNYYLIINTNYIHYPLQYPCGPKKFMLSEQFCNCIFLNVLISLDIFHKLIECSYQEEGK